MRVDDANRLTATEQKLLDAVKDGESKTIEELTTLLDPASLKNDVVELLRAHMSNLRTKMRQTGSDRTVICTDGCYRMVQYVRK